MRYGLNKILAKFFSTVMGLRHGAGSRFERTPGILPVGFILWFNFGSAHIVARHLTQNAPAF